MFKLSQIWALGASPIWPFCPLGTQPSCLTNTAFFLAQSHTPQSLRTLPALNLESDVFPRHSAPFQRKAVFQNRDLCARWVLWIDTHLFLYLRKLKAFGSKQVIPHSSAPSLWGPLPWQKRYCLPYFHWEYICRQHSTHVTAAFTAVASLLQAETLSSIQNPDSRQSWGVMSRWCHFTPRLLIPTPCSAPFNENWNRLFKEKEAVLKPGRSIILFVGLMKNHQ